MSELTPNQRALVRTAKLGFVFQSFNLLPRTTAVSNVLMPLDYSPKRPSLHDSRLRAIELLQRVGLGKRLDHESSQMSGGQQQRVAIARSLINEPALLLADEPTGNLDSKTSVEILEMFQKLNAAGITVILVTHDPKVASYAHRTIWIADGLIESDGPSAPWTGGHGHEASPIGSNGHANSNGNGQTAANGHTASDGPQPAEEPALAAWPAGPHISSTSGAATASALRSAKLVAAGSGPAAAEGPIELQSTQSNGNGVPLPTASTGLAEPFPQTQPEILAIEEDEPEIPAHPHFGASLAALLPTTLGALRRNKMRAALTTLGIIIGIAAVIATVEIGQGVKSANQKTIASMGANNLQIRSGAAASGGISFGTGSVMTLTPPDADVIEARCPAVESIAPMVWTRGTVVYGNRNWLPMNIYGVTPEYLKVRDWEELDEGQMFTDGDLASANKVCIIGRTIARELFQGRSPVGQMIRLQNVSLRVLGVLSPKGANMGGMDQDDVVMLPWTTVKYRVSGSSGNQNQTATTAAATASNSATSTAVNTLNNLYPGTTALYPIPSTTQAADTPQPVRFTNVDSIMVKAVSADQISTAIDQITKVLRERHHLRDDEPDDFNIRDMTEFNKVFTQTTEKISWLILIIAAISLIVGGVGIMNIMLVSVTERTREIGLRMAVGGRSHHILRQFLIEALLLCLIGGGAGILAGRVATTLVRYFKYSPTESSLPAVIAAVLVSVVVGIGFGFYPAWKASRLDPIEALRYE
jgi:ABC-type antimicrobial peptide transport system permease subunit/ABC-type lipoprotein export system ATPase subunit